MNATQTRLAPRSSARPAAAIVRSLRPASILASVCAVAVAALPLPMTFALAQDNAPSPTATTAPTSSSSPAAATATATTAGTPAASTAQLVAKHDIRQGLVAHEYRLKNGLTVMLVPNTKAPLTSVYHWVKAGSLHETPGITGIAHLFEHMMFRPLKKDAPPFMDQVRKLGGNANANTRFEGTQYTTTVPTRQLGALLKIESERFKTLEVTNELLDIERKAVWSEYSTKFDANPTIDLYDKVYKTAYKGHPYGWMIIGFREDLEKIKAKDCNTFFDKYYRPNNTGLFIGGSFELEPTLALVESLYGDWKSGTESQLPPPYTGPRALTVVEGKHPSPVKQLIAGWRIPGFDPKNTDLMNFANFVLFDSSFNLAKRRLVDRERVAAYAGGFNFSYDNGMLKAYASLLPGKKVDDAVAEFAKLPADFDALSAEEFNAYLKEFQVGQSEGMFRNEDIVDNLATSWGRYGSVSWALDWAKKPMDLKKDDVGAFIKATLTQDNTTVAHTK